MKHLVLLGDSIFDNAPYVPIGLSVIEQLNNELQEPDRATLLAVDGAVTSSVLSQLGRFPANATHLFLSVGGNDALGLSSGIFGEASDNVGSAMAHAHEMLRAFATGYRSLIDKLQKLGKPLTICTIYDAVPGLRAHELGGLAMFNDIITRTAFAAGADLLDLRLLCNDRHDYSELSPIEPSDRGGRKIAQAIAHAVSEHALPVKRSRIIA